MGKLSKIFKSQSKSAQPIQSANPVGSVSPGSPATSFSAEDGTATFSFVPAATGEYGLCYKYAALNAFLEPEVRRDLVA